MLQPPVVSPLSRALMMALHCSSAGIAMETCMHRQSCITGAKTALEVSVCSAVGWKLMPHTNVC